MASEVFFKVTVSSHSSYCFILFLTVFVSECTIDEQQPICI
jgi:hypothetical protein